MRQLAVFLFAPLVALGCPQREPVDDGTPITLTDDDIRSVVDHYAVLVEQNYRDALAGAVALQAAVTSFAAAPSAAGLDAAKAAWAAARIPYGESEAYRFYAGPIDDDVNGPEGSLNAWPIDEAHIDGVEGAPDVGFVQDIDGVPTLDRSAIVGLNGTGGEENVTTGWHAIEFLLWGQDLDDDGPGARPYTDFLTGELATRPHGDRRALALQIMTDLLVDDLEILVAAWAPGANNYRAEFVATPRASLEKIVTGVAFLSGIELAGERMFVAYDTRLQEDEHSCFSDTTTVDLVANAKAVDNVLHGRYEPHILDANTVAGPSLLSLVRIVDEALAIRVEDEVRAGLTAVKAIPAPFDRTILAQDSAPERKALLTAIEEVEIQASTLLQVGAAFGFAISFPEPELDAE